MVMIVPSSLTVIMLDDGARGGRTVHTSVFQDRDRKAMTDCMCHLLNSGMQQIVQLQ
jgi:hypothetical protein